MSSLHPRTSFLIPRLTLTLMMGLSRPAAAQSPPALAAAVTTPPSSEPSASAPRRVRLRLRGDGTLERHVYVRNRDGEDDEWRPVCEAPCSVEVDPRESFRVAGKGRTATPTLALEGARGPVDVVAETGSTAARVTGIVALSVGGLAAVQGLALAALSAVSKRNDDPGLDNSKSDQSADRTQNIGLGVAAIGAVVMGVGGILMATGRSTAVVREAPASADARRSEGFRWMPNGFQF